jgi:hypothetical protein
MTELVPATLQRLIRKGNPARNQPAKVVRDGKPINVQFNPATMKITRRNNVDRSGATTNSQKAQRPSSEASSLTFDLEFDTAEQGTATARVDVRKWTALVRQFVEPPPATPADPPPAVEFAWGTLVFRGIIEQVTEDIDYFAPDGTALHAKVNVTISEQDFALEAVKGAAAKDDKAARDPGETSPGTALGNSGTDDPRQLVAALDGESAQELLSRLGKDPAAWRGAMSGIDSPLGLAAGASVQLGAEVDAASGIATTTHFTADAAITSPDRLADALGLTVGTAASDARSAGFALSAAGGIASAAARVELAVTEAQVRATRSAFEVPTAVSRVAMPDTRAVTYGRGIPLQLRVKVLPDAGNDRVPGHDRADAEQRRRDAGMSTLRWTPGR